MTFYEQRESFRLPREEIREMSASSPQQSQKAQTFMSGVASGALTSIVLQPFDVLRTRLQITGQPMLVTMRTLVEERGISVLWQGATPTVSIISTVQQEGERKEQHVGIRLEVPFFVFDSFGCAVVTTFFFCGVI